MRIAAVGFVTPTSVAGPTQNTNFHKLCLEQGRGRNGLLNGRLAAVPLDVMAPLALQPFDQVYLTDAPALCRRTGDLLQRNHCLPARVPELLRHDLNGSLTEIYQARPDIYQYAFVVLSNLYATAGGGGAGVMEGRPACCCAV